MYRYNPFITTYVFSEETTLPFTNLQIFTDEDEISVRLWNNKSKNEILDMTLYIKRENNEIPDKWQNLESENTKMLYLLESEEFADVVFLVGDDFRKCFKAHKIYLAAASKIFEEYFLKENHQAYSIVEIMDIDPYTFESLLYFIYVSKLKTDSVAEAISLQSVAQKFQLNELVSYCKEYIKDFLTPSNVCCILAHAIRDNDKDLQTICKRLIAVETKDVLLSDGFLNSSLDIVMTIIGMKNLCYESEALLFTQLCRWSWTECCKIKGNDDVTMEEIRTMMEPFLPFISFLSMSREEFFHYAIPCKILTRAEASAIFDNIVNPEIKELPDWCWDGQRKADFNLRPWQYKWKTTWICELYCSNKKKLKKKLGYAGCKFDLKYKDIEIYGICFSADTESDIVLSDSYETAIWFLHPMKSHFKKYHGKLSYVPTREMFKISFLKPIFLEMGGTYTFLIDSRPLFKEGEWCSCANLLNITPNDVEGVVFIFQQFSRRYKPFLTIDHPHQLLFKIR